MSKLPLDLAKFRKIKSDQHTSTFRHHEGHEITIAHNKLSSKLKSQLDSLPLAKQKVQKFAEGSAGVEDTGEAVGDDASQTASAAPQQQAQQESSDNSLQGAANLPEPPANPDPFGTIESIQNQISGIEKTGTGQEKEAKARGQQGTTNIAEEAAYQKQRQTDADELNQKLKPILDESNALRTDIANGHINPQRYIESMSTGEKIANGISLILGGMGAGLTHGPNLAFQYMQNQIDNDINAQRVDLGKKENLLAHNLRLTHDLREAANITRIQSNEMLASHLRMTADQTADPIEKAHVMQIAGMTDQHTAELQHQMAMLKMQQAAFSGQGGPQSGMLLESLPPEMRERAVQLPGGGMRLAVTKEGAKAVREQLSSIQPIFDSLDKLQSLGPSAFVGGMPANRTAKAIQAQLIPLVNENAGLKRLSSEDIHNIKQMFTDPTKLSSIFSGPAATNSFKQFLQNKLMSTMQNQLEGGAGQGQHQAQTGQVRFKKSGKS